MTYLWQVERGSKYYRVQTDNKHIADKLKRRNKFTLEMYAINRNLWIYLCVFSRPDIAKKAIQSVTKSKPQIDSEGLICFE